MVFDLYFVMLQLIFLWSKNTAYVASSLPAHLYFQAPLFLEGWDEALHEIGKLSSEIILSTKNAESLLDAVEDMPVLVIAGGEDSLVSLKSCQAMASKFINSVSIIPLSIFS